MRRRLFRIVFWPFRLVALARRPDPRRGRGVVVRVSDPQRCPECLQGKHANCTEQLLDDEDEWVPCMCAHGVVS